MGFELKVEPLEPRLTVHVWYTPPSRLAGMEWMDRIAPVGRRWRARLRASGRASNRTICKLAALRRWYAKNRIPPPKRSKVWFPSPNILTL